MRNEFRISFGRTIRRQAASSLSRSGLLSPTDIESDLMLKRQPLTGRLPRVLHMLCCVNICGRAFFRENFMRSDIFKDHGLRDADYDFEAGRDQFNLPVVNFREPGGRLQMIDLTGANQIGRKFAAAGDAEGASLFDRLVSEARRGLVSTAPLYVDAGRAARMEHGAKTEDFFTLQEAKIAWDQLPADRREIARIMSAGHIYERSEIERFHYQRSAFAQI